MKAGEDARGVRSEGPRKLGLCVLCGLPAAGKSTLARALSHRLRQELGWAVGLVAYDDVMPDAFFEEANPLDIDFGFSFLLDGWQLAMTTLLAKAKYKVQFCDLLQPSQWKLLRQELLKYLENFLLAVINGLKLTDLLLTALENPIKYVEDNVEQKETDRIICSTNILHQVDQTLRRAVSQTMKEAKDEQLLPYKLKLLAEELNKLKAEFLEDLRQGNKKYLCFRETIDLSDVISFFHYEKDNIVQKYFSKQH
ncbi:L-seryl-tRNA kinase [Camelus dromedarius]|uniref:L-seryl-tRNA kinase n=1 Tax=Camelus dromedarius TaxID=9838 RepID=A0A5N4DIY0_CAMDR|nr:L-seryl-tRNA kinase [Camelus dromedarius]